MDEPTSTPRLHAIVHLRLGCSVEKGIDELTATELLDIASSLAERHEVELAKGLTEALKEPKAMRVKIISTACAWCGCAYEKHFNGGRCMYSDCECRHYAPSRETVLQRYDHVAASTGTWMEKSKDGDWVSADEAFAEIEKLKDRIEELEGGT